METEGKEGKAPAPSKVEAGTQLEELQKAGLDLLDNPREGNCFFHCWGQVLQGKKENGARPELGHAMARQKIVAHMAAHKDQYEPFWDGRCPSAEEEPCPSMDRYLEKL